MIVAFGSEALLFEAISAKHYRWGSILNDRNRDELVAQQLRNILRLSAGYAELSMGEPLTTFWQQEVPPRPEEPYIATYSASEAGWAIHVLLTRLGLHIRYHYSPEFAQIDHRLRPEFVAYDDILRIDYPLDLGKDAHGARTVMLDIRGGQFVRIPFEPVSRYPEDVDGSFGALNRVTGPLAFVRCTGGEYFIGVCPWDGWHSPASEELYVAARQVAAECSDVSIPALSRAGVSTETLARTIVIEFGADAFAFNAISPEEFVVDGKRRRVATHGGAFQ